MLELLVGFVAMVLIVHVSIAVGKVAVEVWRLAVEVAEQLRMACAAILGWFVFLTKGLLFLVEAGVVFMIGAPVTYCAVVLRGTLRFLLFPFRVSAARRVLIANQRKLWASQGIAYQLPVSLRATEWSTSKNLLRLSKAGSICVLVGCVFYLIFALDRGSGFESEEALRLSVMFGLDPAEVDETSVFESRPTQLGIGEERTAATDEESVEAEQPTDLDAPAPVAAEQNGAFQSGDVVGRIGTLQDTTGARPALTVTVDPVEVNETSSQSRATRIGVAEQQTAVRDEESIEAERPAEVDVVREVAANQAEASPNRGTYPTLPASLNTDEARRAPTVGVDPTEATETLTFEGLTNRLGIGSDRGLAHREIAIPSIRVGGGLSSRDVDAVVGSHRAGLRSCFDPESDIQADVIVRWTVAFDGSVAQTTTDATVSGLQEVDSCLRRAVQRMEFPRPTGGANVAVVVNLRVGATDSERRSVESDEDVVELPGAVITIHLLTEALVAEFFGAWLATQNTGDFSSYQTLYATDFTGIKRAGKRMREYDREGWLADRRRMFRDPMVVVGLDANYTVQPTMAEIQFTQIWESAGFRDQGPKLLLVVIEDGQLRIRREEMIHSAVQTPH